MYLNAPCEWFWLLYNHLAFSNCNSVKLQVKFEISSFFKMFVSFGRVIEGIFRSLNNLLEQFHQSFFFYLLPESHQYVSIGMYMPPFGCLLLGPAIMAIVLWTLAGSAPENGSKVETSQEGGASEEESGVKKAASETSEGKDKEPPDLEDKVCFTLFYPLHYSCVGDTM